MGSGQRVNGDRCHCQRSEAISIPLCAPMEIMSMPPGLALGSLCSQETQFVFNVTFIVMAGLVPAISRGTLPLRMAGQARP